MKELQVGELARSVQGNLGASLRRAVPSAELAWSPLGIRGKGEGGRGKGN